MLYEYAVEPKAIGSSWHNFRYLIEKFGFDRGRVISRFPRKWERDVIAAADAADLSDMKREKLVELLSRAKTTARSGRPYDPAAGDWLQNAINQQAVKPFHAIIASENPQAREFIVIAEDADEAHPLMVSQHYILHNRST
jgi:hypothetical protein